MTVVLTACEPFIEDKLAAIVAIDPSTAGGIDGISIDQLSIEPQGRVPNVLSRGFEEVHLVDEGFCAHFADGRVSRPWRLTARSTENCLRLRIPFTGEAHHDSSQDGISDLKSRCTFIIQPAGASLTGVYRGGEEYRFCSLNLSQSFLSERLGLMPSELPRALLSGWQKQETAFGRIELVRASLTTANRFFCLSSQGAWRRSEIKVIALELLRQILEAWTESSPSSDTHVKLRPSERDQLQRLRKLAEDRSPRPISMAEAITLSGLNKNKVHVGFKRIFGMSLHDYCFDLRMQRARKLLTETNLPIVQIADAVGFSEPTNFTAAFRKHFTILPSQIRGSLQGGRGGAGPTAIAYDISIPVRTWK